VVTWTGYDEDTVPGWNVVVSPDLDAYAAGRIGVEQIECLMCERKPCSCTTDFPFGSPQYLARTREIHGRKS
jgi:hypothetical protein